MEIEEVLNRLAKLDLSTFPEKEASELLNKIGKMGAVNITLYPGKRIFRARPNYDGERFSIPSELSFKPQSLNKSYQRASSPRRTMFYASFNAEVQDPNKPPPYPPLICALETFNWFREPDKKGVQTITFGKWKVIKPINLIAIVHHKNFYERNVYTKELVDAFQKDLENHPLKDRTLLILDFFANHFANKDADAQHSHLYMLCAMFTEQILKDQNFQGVIYPSVQVNGEAFNLAITPEAANDCLELEVAGEGTCYKYLLNATIDHETIVELKEGEKSFNLQPVLPQYHKGMNTYLQEWGITMEELCKDCTITVRDIKKKV